MTATTKWVLGLVGFVICFYLGWFFPVLWLMLLGLIVILLAIPTKKPTVATITQPVSVAQAVAPAQTYTVPNTDEIIRAIEEKIRLTEDEGVREGLRQALDEVTRFAPRPAEAMNVTQLSASIFSPTSSTRRNG